MWQLLVTVISVVVLSAFGYIGVHYFGDHISDSTYLSALTRYNSQARQIEFAMTIHYAEEQMLPPGNDDALLNGLVATEYLSAKPTGDWHVSSSEIYLAIDDAAYCKNLNKAADFDVETSSLPSKWEGCPPCKTGVDTGETLVGEFASWPACQMPK
ncbi:hypothetical protein ACQU0X_26755 [Pseudovibrio ascidiaceicola]|uniref:hypothetical protein n=1 Tax=Pseudovibrio ascidiaceicola TaxID=285279 RepID=UPI003D36ADBE